MQKTDAIFPFFMMSQLPAGVAGLLIAAVFAATMSTISSNINSISTAFTVDIWKKHRPQLSDKATVQTARLTGIVSGLIGMLIAILMATMNIQSLLDYFNTILGLLSGAVGALFIMGIFFPRIGARAAFVGFVAGTLTVFWMNFCTTANFLLFGFTAIVVSTLVALLLSLAWPERRPLKGFTWKTLE
jgi:Na+/proline symporter